MNKKIVFRRMDHSPSMEDYANQQLDKIMEFLEKEPTPVYVDLILQPSKVHAHHNIELRVKSPSYDRVSNYEGPDFYQVMDRVIDVMYHALREDSKRRKDNLKAVGRHDDFKKQR